MIHDWGSALGFDWANRNRDRVAGIAYMEGLVTPVTWADWPENARRAFQGFRSEGGEDMILQKNMFVERVLPGSVIRKMSDDEMAEYRRPFANPGEDRRPTLTWPRQIPIEGEPADVGEVVEDYSAWLATSDVPKLFINADPGSILVGRQREVCRAWPNQTEVTVKGLHFIQEDSPDEIGQAVAAFVKRCAASRAFGERLRMETFAWGCFSKFCRQLQRSVAVLRGSLRSHLILDEDRVTPGSARGSPGPP